METPEYQATEATAPAILRSVSTWIILPVNSEGDPLEGVWSLSFRWTLVLAALAQVTGLAACWNLPPGVLSEIKPDSESSVF